MASTIKSLKGRKTLSGKEDYVATSNDLANTFSYIQSRLSMGATHRTYVRSYATRSGSARTDPAKLQRPRRCVSLHCLHTSVEVYSWSDMSAEHNLVRAVGLEPTTSGLRSRYSTSLSYALMFLADVTGASPVSLVLTAPAIFCANASAHTSKFGQGTGDRTRSASFQSPRRHQNIP